MPLTSLTCLGSCLCCPGRSPISIPFYLITKQNKTLKPLAHLPVRSSWGLESPDVSCSPVLCPVGGLRAGGCSWTPRLPENLQPETLTSAGRGSWGSIPDLQTQAAHWPRAHDNHFLPGCLPSCSRGSSQGGGPAPEPEAVQEGRRCPW